MQSASINLLNFDCQGLQQFFEQIGEAPFHGKQLFKWLHQHGITDFDAMTNLSKNLRAKLKQIAYIKTPEIAMEQKSKDGTIKWLLKLSDGNSIETVYIPEAGRGTLCVSSQVGCALNCKFCSTAQQGYNRNLSIAEIIGQVFIATRRLSEDKGKHDRKVTNVVMMGMGEPLLNLSAVNSAMNIMMDDLGYGLSKYRVTLSTSGVVPAMYELSKLSDCSLAVSLHAPNDTLRTQIVPINKKYPLNELIKACKAFFKAEPRRHITMEYVMLNKVNDFPHHAKELIQVLKGVPVKVNLIPFNPFPGASYQRSSDERINQFRNILVKAGINTITRKTRGDDIDAACGN